MSKKQYAKKLSELLNIAEHKPIVGGTLSRDWLFTLYEAVCHMRNRENLHNRIYFESYEQPGVQRLGKHALIRTMFKMLGLGGADDHLSTGGTVKGSALAIILSALEARARNQDEEPVGDLEG